MSFPASLSIGGSGMAAAPTRSSDGSDPESQQRRAQERLASILANRERSDERIAELESHAISMALEMAADAPGRGTLAEQARAEAKLAKLGAIESAILAVRRIASVSGDAESMARAEIKRLEPEVEAMRTWRAEHEAKERAAEAKRDQARRVAAEREQLVQAYVSSDDAKRMEILRTMKPTARALLYVDITRSPYLLTAYQSRATPGERVLLEGK